VKAVGMIPCDKRQFVVLSPKALARLVDFVGLENQARISAPKKGSCEFAGTQGKKGIPL